MTKEASFSSWSSDLRGCFSRASLMKSRTVWGSILPSFEGSNTEQCLLNKSLLKTKSLCVCFKTTKGLFLRLGARFLGMVGSNCVVEGSSWDWQRVR